MTSFERVAIKVIVCAMVKSIHLVDGLVWVGLVCQVVFGELRRPFGSGRGIKVRSSNAQRRC